MRAEIQMQREKHFLTFIKLQNEALQREEV